MIKNIVATVAFAAVEVGLWMEYGLGTAFIVGGAFILGCLIWSHLRGGR